MLLVGSFAVELKFRDSMNVSQVSWGFFGALIVPYLMLSLVRIFQMDFQPVGQTDFHVGQFIVLLPLLAAWGADTCTVRGHVLWRAKLAPVVSPKKTVEGAVGGVVGGAMLVLLAVLVMNALMGLDMPIWAALVLGGVGAVLGEIGDLSFSIIKRQTGISDYGHIFPATAACSTASDSVLFVAPFAEILFRSSGKSRIGLQASYIRTLVPEETKVRYPNVAAQGGWVGVSKHPAKLGVWMEMARPFPN